MKANFLATQLSPPSEFPVARVSSVVFSLLAVYVWILPIGHTIFIRNLAFFSLLGLTLWLSYRGELKLRWPLLGPWVLYGVIAIISVVYAINPAYSLGEVKKEVGYSILALMLGATWIRGIPSLSRFILILILGDSLLVGSALVKAFVLTPFWKEKAIPSYDALYNGVGNFSTYLVIVLPLLVAFSFVLPQARHTWRKWLAGLFLANLAALYLTGNRMGLLVVIFEILFSAVIWHGVSRKNSGIKSFGVGLIILFLSWSSIYIFKARSHSTDISATLSQTITADPRWNIWSTAIDNIRNQPFNGGGFGREAFKMRNKEFWKNHEMLWHAHNMVLNKGVQMGLPGITAFLFLLISVLRRLWPPKSLYYQSNKYWIYALAATTASLGLFMKNMTDDFFVNDIAFLYWLITGALIGSLSQERKEGPPAS